MRLILLFIIVCFSISVSAQVDCVDCLRYFQFIPTPSFPDNSQDFDIRFIIAFEGNQIIFEAEEIEVLQEIQIPVEDKRDLLKEVECMYAFSELSTVLTGHISQYRIEKRAGPLDKNFSIYTLEDCGNSYYYLLNGDGFHQLRPCVRFQNQNASTIGKTPSVFVNQVILYESDTSSSYSLESNIEFETVTEQVLVKSTYDSLVVEPAIFEIDTLTYVYGDSATCEGAIYDTTFVLEKIKSNYSMLEVIEAQFEVVTEQILFKEGFPGVDFYVQDSLINDTLRISSFAYELSLAGIDPNCFASVFMPCLETNIDTTLIKDTSIIRKKYPPCDPGFIQQGRFCFTEGEFVETQYDTRSYSRLVNPASVDVIIIPAEFFSAPYIQILNRESIPDSCIVSLHRTFEKELLIQPPKVDGVSIPATYEGRNYERYVSGSQTLHIEGDGEDKFVNYTSIEGGEYFLGQVNKNVINRLNSCLIDDLASFLIKNNYLSVDDKENTSKVLLKLGQYQLENDLPLGLIDDLLLDKLGIDE